MVDSKTNHKQIEDELHELNEKFRLMIDNSLDVIVIVDCGTGKIVKTNPAMGRVLGYKEDDLLGKSFSFLFPPSLAQGTPSWQKNVRVHGYVFEAQKFARADGSICPMDLTTTMIPWECGTAALLTLRDVTERFQAEEKHRESEEKYRTLFQDSPDAISITREGRLIDANSAWLELHGYTSKTEALGRPIVEFIHPDDRRLLLQRRKTPPHQLESGYEIRDLRKDGSVVHVEVYSSRIRLHGKDAILATVRDISERKNLQKELIQSDKMAAVGTMISGIAHELNNPLAAISGYAHLLTQSEDLPEQACKDVSRIVAQTARCAAIVENLLRFARREKAEKAATDLNEVLQNTVDLRRYEMHVNDVEVIEEYDPDLPRPCVNAHQIQQVFLNIINNAFDAITDHKENGKIEVRTKRDGTCIRVEIEDDGGGIQDIDRIFDPFFTTKDVGKGTGLGLSVAYGILEEHGGSIQAENTAQGALFTIHLPIAEPAAQRKPEKRPVPTRSCSGRKRVLVVDDEESICEAVRRILSADYAVETTTTVSEALEKLKSESYDIVITDLRLPGEVTVEELHAWMEEHIPDLAERTILMTGSVAGGEPRKVLRGIDRPVVAKPFAIEQLRQVVNGVAALT